VCARARASVGRPFPVAASERETRQRALASSSSMKRLASPSRLYSGATVMAVTWPCQFSRSPSTLPITGAASQRGCKTRVRACSAHRSR
jgi:hypothetical protein